MSGYDRSAKRRRCYHHLDDPEYFNDFETDVIEFETDVAEFFFHSLEEDMYIAYCIECVQFLAERPIRPSFNVAILEPFTTGDSTPASPSVMSDDTVFYDPAQVDLALIANDVVEQGGPDDAAGPPDCPLLFRPTLSWPGWPSFEDAQPR